MFVPFEDNKIERGKTIVIASGILHIVVIVAIFIFSAFDKKEEIPKTPIFEMIQVPKPPTPVKPKPPAPPQPKTQPPKEPPKPVKKKKPEPEKPKPKKEKPKEVVKKETPPDTIPDLDLPPAPPSPPSRVSSANTSSLQTVGSVMMDPLLEEYLEHLVIVLMNNFRPPDGVDIPPGASSRVSFTIQRSGRITGIGLKISSTNGTWDRLGVRAVKISRLPPLPFNYRAPALQLYFDFKEE